MSDLLGLLSRILHALPRSRAGWLGLEAMPKGLHGWLALLLGFKRDRHVADHDRCRGPLIALRAVPEGARR